MTRAPVPGETKTRLQTAVGPKTAAKLAECFFLDCLARARLLPRFQVSVWVAGEIDHAVFSGVAAPCVEQVGANLGARIEHAITVGLHECERVVVIGSDSPDLPISYLAQAYDLLLRPASAKRAVLGPAADGGFYLLGVTSWQDGILGEVSWSESTTFAQTLRALQGAGFEVSFLPPWYDVDDAQALSLLRAHLSRRPKAAPKTASFLDRALFSW